MTFTILALALVAAQEWTPAPPLPAGVDHHATFTTEGSSGPVLNVIGGNNYREQFATHHAATIRADGTLDAWREGRALPAPRAGLSVVIVDGTAFALAGQTTGRRNIPDVSAARVQPDGSLGEWTEAAALPAGRFHHAAVASGPFIYVLGGLETTTSTNTVFRSRVTNGTLGPWEALDTMPRPRSHQAALVHGGAIYQIGGLDGNPAGANTPLSDIIRARILPDGRLGPWERAGQLDSAYGTHGAFIHSNQLYVAGGVENNRRFVATVQRAPVNADGTIGTFVPATSLPNPRAHVHHLPVVRGRVYSVGGSASRVVTADAFLGRL
jgi:hypothetical protein